MTNLKEGQIYRIIDTKGNDFFARLVGRRDDGYLKFQPIEGKGAVGFYENNDWGISILKNFKIFSKNSAVS